MKKRPNKQQNFNDVISEDVQVISEVEFMKMKVADIKKLQYQAYVKLGLIREK